MYTMGTGTMVVVVHGILYLTVTTTSSGDHIPLPMVVVCMVPINEDRRVREQDKAADTFKGKDGVRR